MTSEDKKVGVGIGVMILKKDKVLLGKRNNDPIKADSELSGEGSWTFPGGKMEFGESFEEAAAREVLEETGMRLEKSRVFSVTNDIGGKGHFVTIGLICTDFEGEPKAMEPEKIVKWQWFNSGDLPNPLFISTRKMIEIYNKHK